MGITREGRAVTYMKERLEVGTWRSGRLKRSFSCLPESLKFAKTEMNEEWMCSREGSSLRDIFRSLFFISLGL